MSGYSQRSLAEKLGVRPGARSVVLRAPAGFMELVPELAAVAQSSSRLSDRYDYLQYFATSSEQLGAVWPNLKRHLAPEGMLWVCWVKKSSPLHSGLDENQVRELGLSNGLVDVKVAALTDDWSGLKFVFRTSDRQL